MIIAIGSDTTSYEFKESVKEHLINKAGIEVLDCGATKDEMAYYADVAEKVGKARLNGKAQRGLMFCGGGNGAVIAANKIPGIRATLAVNSYQVEKSVTSSACQILCMGSQLFGLPVSLRLIDEWLSYEYPKELSIHTEKVNELDAKYRK